MTQSRKDWTDADWAEYDRKVWSLYHRFTRRLKAIGIEVEMSSNVPWLYLDKVNSKEVEERYMAEHGFTAMWMPIRLDDVIKFSDRRKVFAKIREMVE